MIDELPELHEAVTGDGLPDLDTAFVKAIAPTVHALTSDMLAVLNAATVWQVSTGVLSDVAALRVRQVSALMVADILCAVAGTDAADLLETIQHHIKGKAFMHPRRFH